MMNGSRLRPPILGEVGLPILLGVLTYAGLALATGKIPFFGIPEEVTIPLYIMLYSFLGGVAYLLSALLGEYKLRGDEERRLEALRKGLEKRKKGLERRDQGTEAGTGEFAEVNEQLGKVTAELDDLRANWIESMDVRVKIARIPFGMLMAAAFFLVARQIVSQDILDALGPQLLAGAAFVVAFFPKVIMEGLNGLASRLIGKGRA